MDLHAGALLERAPGPKYSSALGFAELAFVDASLPKAKTLRSWRETVPESFEVALRVPRSITHELIDDQLALGEELADADWLSDAIAATGARFVVLATGSEAKTSRRDRERLGALFGALAELAGADVPLVWAPTGLWDSDLARPFAQKSGVIYAYDPLEDDPPAGTLHYASLRALGFRQRFSDGVLYELVERLEENGAERAYVSLESPHSFKEAQLLQALAAG